MSAARIPALRVVLATLMAGLLVLATATTGAAKAKPGKGRFTADREGDTMTYDIDRGLWQPTPNNEDGDILGIRVFNQKQAVRVKVTFAKLISSAPTRRSARYTVALATGDGLTLRSVADFAQAPGNPVATSSALGNQVACSPKATWAFGDGALTLRFPNACFARSLDRAAGFSKHKAVSVTATTKILTDRHDGDFHLMITDSAVGSGYLRRR